MILEEGSLMRHQILHLKFCRHMDAYIDFPNFCSYLMSMSNQDFVKCNEALLGSFNLYFTFDKSEILKAKKEVKKNFDIWSRSATRNRNGKKNDWKINFPPRPVNNSIHETFTEEQLSSIYMIDGENVTQWANKGCLLIAEKGKELDTIKKLQIADAFNPTKQFRIRSMVDWSTFGDNSSPCTDIILVDQYVFSQSEYEYDVNSYALLEQLCKWAKGATVNIVIFTLKDYKDVNSYYPVPFVSITRNLKQKLGELIGAEPNITFVVLPGQEQHDRTILTNYKMYTSGDSFKYFKDGTNVSLCTHGEWMYISSLHDLDNFQNAKEFISDLQDVIDKVKGGLMSIQGDKKSFYLRF